MYVRISYELFLGLILMEDIGGEDLFELVRY